MKEVLLDYQNIEINLLVFVTNLLIAFLLSHILSLVYVKYSNSLSNKKIFSNNFYLITLTTTLIITVVKSSLALSLGLVGALSIVRFRAAIKEPEEIAYL
jgi:ABC-type Fe3+ transport system permease subunit